MTEENNLPPQVDGAPASEPLRLSFVDRHSMHPLLFALTVLAGVFLLYQGGGAVLTFLVIGLTPLTRENIVMIRWLTVIGQVGFILVPTLLFARMFSMHPSEIFRFRVPGLRESTAALIALFSLQRVLEAYMFFQDRIPMPDVLREVLEPLRKIFEEATRLLVQANSPMELAGVIFVVAIMPALVEELLFRGLVQNVFERLVSPAVAAVFAGTLFGLYHMEPFELVPLIGLGVFFGLLRYRSASLWLPMAAHFFNNLVAVLASYYGLMDDNLLAATQSDVNIPAMLAEMAFFAVLFYTSFVLYLRFTRLVPHEEHRP